MTKVKAQDTISLVCGATNLPEESAADWLISRAAQGLLHGYARTEEWVRPTLDLDGEREGFENCLAVVGNNELLAYVQFALDMLEDDIPLTWEHVVLHNVQIAREFWTWRDATDDLWAQGCFLGRHDELPSFQYNLVGIEFDRRELDQLLGIYRSAAASSENNVVNLFASSEDRTHRCPEPDGVSQKQSSRASQPSGFHISDLKLMPEMHSLLMSGEATSSHDAAWRLVDKAKKRGEDKSVVKRLMERYKEWLLVGPN